METVSNIRIINPIAINRAKRAQKFYGMAATTKAAERLMELGERELNREIEEASRGSRDSNAPSASTSPASTHAPEKSVA